MKRTIFISISILSMIINVKSYAVDDHAHHHHHSHDDHIISPIGVMGSHLHEAGDWMVSYRYSNMFMDGNRNGTSSVSDDAVLNDFMVTPTEMTMEMHMFGLMYGVNDKLTLMAMAPYVLKSMDHRNRMGVEFTTETEGIGDVKLTGLYKLWEKGNTSIHVNLGMSLPTGAIDERDDTPAGANSKLPYPMQLGSGTYDPLIGLTYNGYKDKWSWGAQANSVIRLGRNDEGYRLGNEYGATTWVSRALNEVASVSFRLDGKVWNDINGADADLNPAMIATARTDLRGGKRLDALVGLNLLATDGKLKDHRLAFEFGMPVYQDLDGPQLEMDYRFILGWQYSF